MILDAEREGDAYEGCSPGTPRTSRPARGSTVTRARAHPGIVDVMRPTASMRV